MSWGLLIYVSTGQLLNDNDTDDDFVEPKTLRKQNNAKALVGIQEIYDIRLKELGVTDEMMQNEM